MSYKIHTFPKLFTLWTTNVKMLLINQRMHGEKICVKSDLLIPAYTVWSRGFIKNHVCIYGVFCLYNFASGGALFIPYETGIF